MATESEDNMKVKDYKNIKDYIKKTKGITICKAKNVMNHYTTIKVHQIRNTV